MPNKVECDAAAVAILEAGSELGSVDDLDEALLSPMIPVLTDEYGHSRLEVPLKQPDAERALENTPEFREAARKAWASVSYGDLPQEAGAMILPDGKATRIQVGKEIGSTERRGSIVFRIPADGVFVTIHTHPRPTAGKRWIQEPSQVDIDLARKNRENVYVVTSSGLWQVEPDGKVNHLFVNNDWMRGRK